MCGISVIFHKHSKPENEFPIMNKMLDKISHRGKDQISITEYNTCTVGFRRLAITDIEEKQPQGNSWVVYLNGEIYNYKELGFEGSECSVISQGIERHGIDFIKRLNGMFFILAICGDKVFVFRDRYGIKPVYYYQNDELIIVSSEIKSIIEYPSYLFSLNDNARRQWFVFNNILTDETLFNGVYKLEKGTAWHLNTGLKCKFWEWKFQPDEIDFIEASKELERLVWQAVKGQTPKLELGTCLSGGVDSNILKRIAGDIYSFTVGYAGEEDERQLSELACGKHYEVVYNQVRNFDKTIYHLEDLRVGASWSNYGLYELASKFVKVCFDGAGSDELFSGYSWRYSAKNYYDVVNRTGIKDEYCEEVFKKIFPEDTLENRFEFDANYFLEGVLLVVDKLSMAHTMEMRVPFLDNDLVDFCLKLPNRFKTNKHILKNTFSYIIPRDIIEGKKKGFTSPDWIKGEGNQALKWATAAFNQWEKTYR